MKRVTILSVILLLAFANSCLAVSFVQEWSTTQQVITWNISHSGKFIGFINDDTYQILNHQGSVVKQGKNIWRGDWIKVADDMFLVGNGLDSVNRLYTYQGELLSTQNCWSYSFFSPSGKYIFYGWGEDYYAVCTPDGDRLSDGICFSNWEPLAISPSEQYIATPYDGLYKIANGKMVRVLDGNFSNATYAGNEEFLILELTNQESNQISWKMYDRNLQEVWSREQVQGRIYGHKTGYVIITDQILTFCNLQNKVLAERSLTTAIRDVYFPLNRDFFLIYTSDTLYLFNYAGKNIAQVPHNFSDPVWITPTGDRLYTFREIVLDQESKHGYGPLTQVTVASYLIKY